MFMIKSLCKTQWRKHGQLTLSSPWHFMHIVTVSLSSSNEYALRTARASSKLCKGTVWLCRK